MSMGFSAIGDSEIAHFVNEKLEQTVLFHRLLVRLLQEPIHASLSEVHSDRLVSHVMVLKNDVLLRKRFGHAEEIADEPLANRRITGNDDRQSLRAPPLAGVSVESLFESL